MLRFTLLRLGLVGVSFLWVLCYFEFLCLFIMSSLGLCALVGPMLLFYLVIALVAATGARSILALALFLAILFLH